MESGGKDGVGRDVDMPRFCAVCGVVSTHAAYVYVSMSLRFGNSVKTTDLSLHL